VIIFEKVVFGNPVPGYPSLMVVILFLGGVQLISVGIRGEYLGRLFEESKQRPLYLLQDYHSAATAPRPAAPVVPADRFLVPRIVGTSGVSTPP
jgi:polyisoprenyl-phosphate glycosyltransferase